jgi:CRISPR-associated protein Csb2
MPAHALLIEVRLLDGRYHGVGDWPPSPFRLFQALVAGAYGGRWRREPDDVKDSVFHWLERLGPPHVAAPAKLSGRTVTYFVPNNDLDAVGGDPRRVSEIRAGKTVRPILFDADTPCLYVWPFDEGEDLARRLCRLAERLHTLGWGIDAAFARAAISDWAEAEARLVSHGGAISRPGSSGQARDPTCPTRGSLDSLKQRYEATAHRFETRREGRATVTRFHQPPKPRFRTIAYDRPPSRLLYDLRPADGAQTFSRVAQERAVDVAKAVRDLAARRLAEALPSRAAEFECFIAGRGSGPTDVSRRVRVIPLPSIGFVHADPAIRRVLVEIPPDCPVSVDDVGWAISGQSLKRVDSDSGGVKEIILAMADDDSMLGHYGINRRGSRRWQSVTPIVLPEQRPRGRVSGTEREGADRRAAAAVAEALRHAGRAGRGVDVRVQAEPFHPKGARADAFRSDRFAGRLRHVELTFPDPIAGPLVIGDGRWLGLGVMRPVSAAPPGVHVFAIDSAGAPPIAEREELARALRRAVMARVDEELRREHRYRGEPLATFFTGHTTNGAPARSGRHEHLFFLADDVDGDGYIDRLVVLSPHLADRSFGRGSENRSIMEHLRLLDQALLGLTVLRAGQAGIAHLSRVPQPGDDDPVFGRARRWVSRSLYRPTRHPRENIETQLGDDLIRECLRRGLPRPEVEILEIKTGLRGGLSVRAGLRFAVTVRGPLLLGAGSHFGAGLFAVLIK